ncbi:hypothetical protein Tco_0614869 [Tanacetum coccineum]
MLLEGSADTSDTHLAMLAIPNISIGGKDVYLIRRLNKGWIEGGYDWRAVTRDWDAPPWPRSFLSPL